LNANMSPSQTKTQLPSAAHSSNALIKHHAVKPKPKPQIYIYIFVDQLLHNLLTPIAIPFSKVDGTQLQESFLLGASINAQARASSCFQQLTINSLRTRCSRSNSLKSRWRRIGPRVMWCLRWCLKRRLRNRSPDERCGRV